MSIDLDKIKQQRKQGFSSEKATAEMKVGAILSDLEAIGKDMVQHYPRISESMFVNNYLLAFAGRGESIEDNYAAYLSWVSDIAQNYNMPVHVCDNQTRAVLFTVPAVSNVGTINPAKADTKEISKAIGTANDARFLQPHKWEQMLRDNLFGIYKKVYDGGKAVNEDQQTWMDIFARYESILSKSKPLVASEDLMAGSFKENKSMVTGKASAAQSFDEVDEPV